MKLPELKAPTKEMLEASQQNRKENEVRRDIQKIEVLANVYDHNRCLELHRYLDGKYQYCIADWGKSMWGYTEGLGFSYDVLGTDSLKENIFLMKPKLEAFMHGWNAVQPLVHASPATDVNVTVNNNVTVNVTFDQVRSKIEDMTALNRKQTDEILEKINELERIDNEKVSRKNKWEKVKPIIAFALDKGADVAIAILSLVMQMKLGN